ncbi:hypothetical protein COCSADRAFT_344099 [Bipolaris sorokiniana ND90Pr]|uniref:Uncharacterized protein n=1 Tax=Cochliobolus sativus (strain ND90Pr / ATCC 201652) TaxID=665912 RepID=M2SWV2_COCSN|nr:uncharacterized protein COCSADRAFT_344099 [Bipolaris sorokiniana ND90Pr]EMD61312.1 hypothetical protein COCSADRAFT_344099 [Bipolaris sorokiniana ND90Pr]
MTQPATRKPPNPILYLLGFDCYPDDREYFEARHATGSATPYWFKEKLVYEDIATRPPTQTVVSGALKSSMDGTREYGNDSKTVKVEVRETIGDDEAREETKMPNTKKTKEKKHPAKQPSKSPPRKTITIPLPKRHVVFTWAPKQQQRPHASLSRRAHNPLQRQRSRKPKHAVSHQEHTDTRPLLSTTPQPFLHFSYDTRLDTYPVPLLQPPARLEHQGNRSSTV